MEGTLRYNPSNVINKTGFESPVWEYDHTVGNATVGGFVYRGKALLELCGSYIFGDYVSGRIWSMARFDNNNRGVMELLKSGLATTSFGIDDKNELLICAQNGSTHKILKSPYLIL